MKYERATVRSIEQIDGVGLCSDGSRASANSSQQCLNGENNMKGAYDFCGVGSGGDPLTYLCNGPGHAPDNGICNSFGVQADGWASCGTGMDVDEGPCWNGVNV